MNTVALQGVAATPWRNRGGTTRELLAWPKPSDWRVRLSVAEVVADGPFSVFPGVQRWFAVLAGAGVRLVVGEARHVLSTASEPLAFDGGLPAHCELVDGPTQDFNLMLQGAQGTMERVRGDLQRPVAAGRLLAVYAHQQGCVVTWAGQPQALPLGTLGWRILDAPMTVRVDSADALWMEIAP